MIASSVLGVLLGAAFIGLLRAARVYPGRRPAHRRSVPAPAFTGFDLADGWPVIHRDCTGLCCRPRQPHEDHGDGTYTCHNCGHPATPYEGARTHA